VPQGNDPGAIPLCLAGVPTARNGANQPADLGIISDRSRETDWYWHGFDT
jgi:hypothetical protein